MEKKEKKHKRRLAITLEPDMIDRIEDESKKMSLKMSGFIGLAVSEYFKKLDN